MKEPFVLTLYRSTSGLNTKVDPARLSVDPETGQTPLAVAVNVDVDISGRITRRKGYVKVYEGPAHSLFYAPEAALCLFVTGSSLCILTKAYTAIELRSDLTPGLTMAYVEAGPFIFYMNGKEKGKIVNQTDNAWVAGDYVGPETTKTFSDPPLGKILELYNGRIYIGSDNVIWYSEPFAYSWFDLARNWIEFSSPVTMIKAVDDGLYVSDSSAVFFLGGPTPTEFSIKMVSKTPAIAGTAVVIDMSMVGDGSRAGSKGALWLSPGGIHLGMQGGQVANLTEKRLVLPDGVIGAGLYKDGAYIATISP